MPHSPAGEPLAELPTASAHCQRWAYGRHSWRHRSDGGFDPSAYTVAELGEADAKTFVTTHHYSRTYPAAARRYGLFDVTGPTPLLAGVAVFGIPVQAAVLTGAFPTLAPYRESLELSRFVLLDAVPANGESWLLARCFARLYTAGVRGVVSFADPVPRRAADGTLIAVGHTGVIYQASGAVYTGRGTPRSLVVLPDGSVLNARAAQKVRRQEQGHEYVERLLCGLGAAAPRAGQVPADWLAAALEQVGARRLRHRGAHRYLFPLGRSRREKDRVPLGFTDRPAYPKHPDTP